MLMALGGNNFGYLHPAAFTSQAVIAAASEAVAVLKTARVYSWVYNSFLKTPRRSHEDYMCTIIQDLLCSCHARKYWAFFVLIRICKMGIFVDLRPKGILKCQFFWQTLILSIAKKLSWDVKLVLIRRRLHQKCSWSFNHTLKGRGIWCLQKRLTSL